MSNIAANVLLGIGIVLGIFAVVLNMVLLVKRRRERNHYKLVVARVMQNYRVISMTLPLAKTVVDSLKNRNRHLAFDIYESENDPEAFVFVIRGINDPQIENPDVGVLSISATAENYEVAKTALEESSKRRRRRKE